MASYCRNLKGLIVHVGDLNFKYFELEGVRLHAWHRRVIYSYCLFVARYLRQLSYLCELFIGRKYNYIYNRAGVGYPLSSFIPRTTDTRECELREFTKSTYMYI